MHPPIDRKEHHLGVHKDHLPSARKEHILRVRLKDALPELKVGRQSAAIAMMCVAANTWKIFFANTQKMFFANTDIKRSH